MPELPPEPASYVDPETQQDLPADQIASSRDAVVAARRRGREAAR